MCGLGPGCVKPGEQLALVMCFVGGGIPQKNTILRHELQLVLVVTCKD